MKKYQVHPEWTMDTVGKIEEMMVNIVTKNIPYERRPKGYWCDMDNEWVDIPCTYDACSHSCSGCDPRNADPVWAPLNIVDEGLQTDWLYRPAHWWVIDKINSKKVGYELTYHKEDFEGKNKVKVLFEGNYDDCAKYIADHQTWLENNFEAGDEKAQETVNDLAEYIINGFVRSHLTSASAEHYVELFEFLHSKVGAKLSNESIALEDQMKVRAQR